MNYYNEIDPSAAAWLCELIKRGLIPAGDVDTRSITEVKPHELTNYTQCHFFAGIGGWSRALEIAGWPANEPVWTGSCPCQPFSTAGRKLAFGDARHLWPTLKRLIEECRPPTVFGEQVAGSLGRVWLNGVRNDMEGAGYAVGAANLCAAGVGAPHIRQRLYWVADSCRERRKGLVEDNGLSCGKAAAQPKHGNQDAYGRPVLEGRSSGILPFDGLSVGMARSAIRGYGNAIVPPLAAKFITAFVNAHNYLAEKAGS